jgi:hypothetical protein
VAQVCVGCGTRVRLRRPDGAVRCRCGTATRGAPEQLALAPVACGAPPPPSPRVGDLRAWAAGAAAARCEPYAPPQHRQREEGAAAKAARKRARKAAQAASGAYDAPEGMRYELEAWELVLREEREGGGPIPPRLPGAVLGGLISHAGRG